MSLSTIRTQIQTEIGGRTDQNTLIDDQINYAYSEIGTTFRIRELETTAYTTTNDEQYKYLLPDDCFAVLVVKNETDNKLLDEAEILDHDNKDETETGTPTKYAIFNNALYIFDQVPDDNDGDDYTIKIRYWKRPATLVNDSDALLLKQELERGVRLLASSGVHFALNNMERAAMRTQEYTRWLRQYETPREAENKHAHTARFSFGNR